MDWTQLSESAVVFVLINKTETEDQLVLPGLLHILSIIAIIDL